MVQVPGLPSFASPPVVRKVEHGPSNEAGDEAGDVEGEEPDGTVTVWAHAIGANVHLGKRAKEWDRRSPTEPDVLHGEGDEPNPSGVIMGIEDQAFGE